MNLVKRKKRGRPGTGVASIHAETVAMQAGNSDDDVDDAFGVPAVAAGSNAYELLLGGLDRLRDAPLSKARSKASKVKIRQHSTAGARQEQAVDSTPAEQPLHDSNDASSSDDADDRSGGATEELEDTPEVAGQAIADYFSTRFDSSSSVSVDDGKPSSACKDIAHPFPAWPGTTWLTSGQALPQVCPSLALWKGVLANAYVLTSLFTTGILSMIVKCQMIPTLLTASCSCVDARFCIQFCTFVSQPVSLEKVSKCTHRH